MSALPSVMSTYGGQLVAAIVTLNERTMPLMLGALVLDYVSARRVRASWRIALYSPLVLRILLPHTWTLSIPHAPHAMTLLTPVPLALPPPSELAHASASLGWPVAALLAYGAGVFALALGILRRRLAARRLLSGARLVASQFQLPCSLFEHPEAGPMVVGLVSPQIVVPSRLLTTADAFAIATVLRHESAHVSRGDAWLALAMQLLLVVFWPVLPLWGASWRLRQLIEIACDENALELASSDERRQYGHTLLDMAELQSAALHPMSAELQFGSSLRARIEALASTRRWPRAVQLALVGGAAVGFCACSSVGTPREDIVRGPAQLSNAPWAAPTPEEFALISGRAPVQKYCGPLVERVKEHWPRTGAEFERFGPDWVSVVESQWMSVPADDLPPEQLAFCRSARSVLAVGISFWADEARNGLAQIGKDMAAAFELRRRNGNPTLCPSAPPIPKDPQAPNAPHVQTTPREWNDGAGFECLRFSYSMPTYFQYRMDNDATRFAATARAQRTIDGHLVDLTVVLRGEISDGELVLSPSLEETWKALN